MVLAGLRPLKYAQPLQQGFNNITSAPQIPPPNPPELQRAPASQPICQFRIIRHLPRAPNHTTPYHRISSTIPHSAPIIPKVSSKVLNLPFPNPQLSRTLSNKKQKAMSNIILIGASGFVGSAILTEALSRGHQVTAIVRHPEKVTTSNTNLKVIAADVQNAAALTDIIKGADVVISSYNPGWANPNIYNDTLTGYKAILEAVKSANVTRLLVVGGAGSLYVKPGVTVMDTGVLPEAIMPGVKGLAEVYYNQLKPETTLDWAFFSPAGNIAPGERTGNFRLGKDDLIVNDKGESNISVEDYAVAMINELETPQHHKERFTIGY